MLRSASVRVVHQAAGFPAGALSYNLSWMWRRRGVIAHFPVLFVDKSPAGI